MTIKLYIVCTGLHLINDTFCSYVFAEYQLGKGLLLAATPE